MLCKTIILFCMDTTKQAAIDKLDKFIQSNLKNYSRDRNYDLGPDNRSNISMLSPYLRHRVITEEYVIKQCLSKYPINKIEKFIQEVLWRTYWKGWLELRPVVWKDYKNFLKENTNHALEKVTSFSTNIECFDEWTKELFNHGYLHNHARMWYASIWIHTLKLPWQLGADLFMRHLLDGDPASNTLSWRWVAGLQTRGKSYMATASNIAKFTKNRFNPEPNQLSSVAHDNEFVEYKANSKKYTEFSEVSSAKNIGLLITSEDLDIDSCQQIKIPKHIYLMPYSQQESAIYSDNVKKFKDSLCDDVCKRLLSSDTTLTRSSSSSILEWAKENQIDHIITLATPTGYINDHLMQIKKELTANSINFIKIFRDYDMTYWNYASKGFFNFFQKASQLHSRYF